MLLFTLALGCARPTYVTQPESDLSKQGNQNTSEKVSCGLQFKKSGHCFTWSWAIQPTDEAEGRLILKVFRLNTYDQTAIPIDLEFLPKLVLWMPSMGHGSTPTESSRKDVGTYEINNVFFIMPGEWELRFEIINGKVTEDEAIVNILI